MAQLKPELSGAQLIPLLAALASALCSTSSSVLSDFLLKKEKNKGLLAVSEVSFFNSVIPFFVMPFVMLATGEVHEYGPQWDRLAVTGGDLRLFAAFLCVCLGLGKMCDRLSKFTLIANSGAFFFAILDTFRRMGTGLLSVWMFGEAFTVAKLLSFVLCTVALTMNSIGDHRLKRAKLKRAGNSGGAEEGGLLASLLTVESPMGGEVITVAQWTSAAGRDGGSIFDDAP